MEPTPPHRVVLRGLSAVPELFSQALQGMGRTRALIVPPHDPTDLFVHVRYGAPCQQNLEGLEGLESALQDPYDHGSPLECAAHRVQPRRNTWISPRQAGCSRPVCEPHI